MIERLKNSKLLEDIVVSTTVNKTDDELVKLLKKMISNILEVPRMMFYSGF